jgi:MATE family multidrug resistance protein
MQIESDESSNLRLTDSAQKSELALMLLVAKRQLWTTLPLMGIGFATSLESFITGMLLSKLTDEALAAGSLIGSSNLILSTSIMAPLSASTILIRKAIGERSNSDITFLWRQSLIIGTALSSIRIILLKLALIPILNLITDRPDVVELVQQYFDYYIFGVLFDAWSQAYENFFLGIDRIPLVLLMRCLKLLIYTSSAYLFSQGFLGERGVGITGISIAFGIQSFVSLLIYVLFACCHSQYSKYKLLQNLFSRNLNQLKPLWKMGWPLGLSCLNGMSIEFVLTIFTARFSDPALEVREISGIYNSLLFQPIDAISLSTSMLISESLGEANLNNIIRFGNMGILLGLIFSSIGVGLFTTIPIQLTSLFVDTDTADKNDLVQLMKLTLLLVAFSQFVESVATISYRALAGLQDTFLPTLLAVTLSWFCGLPLAYLLGNETNLGFKGLLIGQGVGMLITSIAMFYRWNQISDNINASLSNRLKRDDDDTNVESTPLLLTPSVTYQATSSHSARLFQSSTFNVVPQFSTANGNILTIRSSK